MTWTLETSSDSNNSVKNTCWITVAIIIGIFFTIGMIITDTFNSFFFSKLLISKSKKITGT